MNKLKFHLINYKDILSSLNIVGGNLDEYLNGGRQDVLENFDIFCENVRSKNKKLKTQFELCSVNENIDKIRKLENDLTFNIEETVELGVVQSGHRALINSKLREKMISQKEIVENRIEFLTKEKIHLQKLVSNYERKNKKMIEKLNDLKIFMNF